MNPRRALALILAVLPAALFAQTPPPVPVGAARKIAVHATGRELAADAFKNGNSEAGLAQLRLSAKMGSKAPSVNAQVVGDLCAIVRSMSVGRHPRARETALLAASEAGRLRGSLSRLEAAAVDAQIGALHELFLGDPARARLSYQSALDADATRKDAKEGLARIARLEALIQAKVQESNTLRARAGK